MPLNNFGFLFDDSPNPMWIFELSDLRILKVNKAAIGHYGYSEKEFLSMGIDDLRSPEDRDRLSTYISGDAAPKHKPTRNLAGVWKHVKKNGEELYAEIISNTIKYEGRDCRIVVANDVTEKVRYQEELIGTKSSLEALINNTEDQIWSVDKELRYVYMNNAYRDRITHLTGHEPHRGDLSYQHAGYTDEIIETWNGYYNRALAGEIYTVVNESPDPETNETLSFEIRFNPIRNTAGDVTGVGCFAHNITQRLKTEKAIIDQNDRLRHIASLTSHELRRPVASMLGLIAVMDRVNFFNPDNQEIIEHLLTVGNEIDEVIRLIVDKTFMQYPNFPDKFQSP
ncbi:MAG TPA: PAS domain S-box protein [Mucilaginibacter sp.]